jgi:folate-dependent phosphoribosylglycinamide formyltransferase PurN
LLLPLDAAAPATIAQNIQAYQPDLVVLDHRAAGLAGLLAQVSQKMMMSHPALPGEFLGDDAIGEAYDAFQRGDILSSGVTIYTLLPNSGDKDVFLKAGVPMLIEDTLEDFATRMQLASQQLLVKALALYAQKYYPSTVN